MINKLRIYILKPVVSLILIITLLFYTSLVASAQIQNYIEFKNRPQYYFSKQISDSSSDEVQQVDDTESYVTQNIRQDPSCDPIPITDSNQSDIEKSLQQYVEKIDNINFNIIIGLGLLVIAFDIITCMAPTFIDFIMTCLEFKIQVKNTQLLSLLRNCLVLNFIMMDNLMKITAPFNRYEFQHCLDPKLIWNLFSRYMDYGLYFTFALAIIQLYSTFFFLILQRNRFGKLFIAFIIINKLIFTSFIILQLKRQYKPFLLVAFLLRQWVLIFQIFKLQGDFIQIQIRTEQLRANRALQKVVY